MSEVEAVALFIEYANTSQQIVLAYVSVLSAFLVMSYFAADKLRWWLMLIVLLLFTLVCALFILQMNLVRHDMTLYYQYLVAEKQAGNMSLMWFGENPVWKVQLLTVIHYVVTFGGYLGCLAFFFYQRRHARDA